MLRVVGWCASVCLAVLAFVAGSAGAAVSAPLSGGDDLAGRIFTVLGTSWEGPRDEAGLATARALTADAVAVVPDGSFLVAAEDRVWRVGSDGRIAVAAGTGKGGFSGDGGPATAARLSYVSGLAVLPGGGFLLADTYNHRVRRVWPDGVITTVAGTGTEGFSGDGGPATAAALAYPAAIAVLPDGGFLIARDIDARVRRVWPDGIITTVAGTGTEGFSGEGGPATAAQLYDAEALAVLPDGGFLIADRDRVRRVWADGTITTFARVTAGALALMSDGSLLAAGYEQYTQAVVKRIGPDGRVFVVAGGGDESAFSRDARFSGEGGPATAAQLDDPHALAALPDGGFLIAAGALRLVVGPGGTDTLAAAIRPGLGTAWARGYRVRYAVTKPARITVRLYRSRKARPAVTAHASAQAGEQTLTAARRRALSPGIYAVDLRANANGQAARTVAYAYLGRRLTEKTIKALTDDLHITFTRRPRAHRADQDPIEDATRCHRFGATRVDCVIVEVDEGDTPKPGDCDWVSSYALARSGQISLRTYSCPPRRNGAPFKRSPHWQEGQTWQDLQAEWRYEN